MAAFLLSLMSRLLGLRTYVIHIINLTSEYFKKCMVLSFVN